MPIRRRCLKAPVTRPDFVKVNDTPGTNTRSNQLFINMADNSNLDGMNFPPIGRVVEGLENVFKLYNGYGEGAPRGRGPDQMRITTEGNAYLKKSFPKLDYILSAVIE